MAGKFLGMHVWIVELEKRQGFSSKSNKGFAVVRLYRLRSGNSTKRSY